MGKIPGKLKQYEDKPTRVQKQKIRKRRAWRLLRPMLILLFAWMVFACIYTFLLGQYWESLLGIMSACLTALMMWGAGKYGINNDHPKIE